MSPDAPADDAARRRLGSLLVAAQFALMGVLAVIGLPAFAALTAPAGAWVLGIAAAALGGWAIATNRPGNFNIRPTPRAGGALVSSGPYRWIRHPMYTSVLGGGAACAWAGLSAWGALAVLVLATVLAVKAGFEERWMASAHPGYADYMRRTRRFLPWLL
jgi:protein-S-isoprenylcysteine O-methyltransferase Ste14